MNGDKNLIAYGPVPSRRLGRSLGINNIPPKRCSYSCVYCQLGRTPHLQVSRQEFYTPQCIFDHVKWKVDASRQKGEFIDYLTFVSDGEPTLDRNLGEEIELLKSLGIKIAVITNASLLWNTEVRNNLARADLVSVKVDTASAKVWRKTNRPHGSLKLNDVLEGIFDFSREYRGTLITESMVLKSLIFMPEEIEKIADFTARVKPSRSYLAVPTRPPAEKWVNAPTELELFGAFILFWEKDINVEYLIGYEGNTFASTGNVKEDLLSITAVHPMRKDAVNAYLKKARRDWDVVATLLSEGQLKEITYDTDKFYVRNLLSTKR